jgi:hypothetical protein
MQVPIEFDEWAGKNAARFSPPIFVLQYNFLTDNSPTAKKSA